MPWDQIVNLYVDLDAYGAPNPFLSGQTESSARAGTLAWVAKDTFTLRIWPRQRVPQQGAPTVSVRLVSDALLIAAKALNNISGGTLLFEADAFTEFQDGGEDWYYETVLTLDTENLQPDPAFPNGLLTLGARADLDIMTADNARRIRLQFNLTINRPVYLGESTPTPASPPYPIPSQILTRALTGVLDASAGVQDYDLNLTTLSLSTAISGMLLTAGLPVGVPAIGASWITDTSINTSINTRIHLDAPPAGTEKFAYLLIK